MQPFSSDCKTAKLLPDTLPVAREQKILLTFIINIPVIRHEESNIRYTCQNVVIYCDCRLGFM